jgi:hypothetical protein
MQDNHEKKIRKEHPEFEVECFLPVPGFVKITVYDRQNKELRNFSDKVSQPGKYKFHFLPLHGPEEFYYYVAQVYNTESFELEYEAKKGISLVNKEQ